MQLITIYDATSHALVFSERMRPGAKCWRHIAAFIARRHGCTADQVVWTDGEITANGELVAFT